MLTTSFRSRLALIAVVGASLGTALPSAASADADAIRPTNVPDWTVSEGQTSDLRIKLTCQRGYGTCTFLVDAIPLTAARPGDFVAKTSPARAKLKIRRAGHSMIATVRFTAVADGVCEGTETARVRVIKRTRREGQRRDYGDITIEDRDCDTPPTPKPDPTPDPQPKPDPTPKPDPAPPLPADSGSPTVRTTALTNGTLGECVTPDWIGTQTTGGWFNRGCAVKVSCPPSAQVCSVHSESRHVLERAIDGERLSLNSRVTVFSAGGVSYWFRDQSSANQGFTRNEDPGVMIRGGESARVECNGVRIAPTVPNRSLIGCSLAVERVS
ncbi:hypothetical protein [Patulibacter defluvii]|uniref:hypothetical protein n=1 Tax=Patulibacter defluvii TaxID=3095358 RepID=UPI002A7571A3|nr:hypothetical protein [Patulibacter sp. DM4]